MRDWMRIVVSLAVLILLPGAMIGATGSAEGQKAAGKPMEISWIGLEGQDIREGNYVQKRIEAQFNVKLVNKVGSVLDNEFRNLMLNTGEMPDAGYMYLDPVRTYLDGQVRTIPKEFIRKYMPNYSKMLDQYPIGWLLNLAPDKKDAYTALCGIQVNLELLIINSFQRLDWMEKTGVPVGTKKLLALDDKGKYFFSRDSFTIEDLDRMFQAFTFADPDGNGKKDTYGLGGIKDDFNFSWGPLLGAYGFANGFNVNDNGKLLEWNIYPGYREFMKKLAEWYAKGYLDPEFTTINRNKQWEKITAGTLGWFMTAFNYADPTRPAFLNRPPLSVTQANAGAKLLMTPPVIGPTGKRGAAMWTPVGPLSNTFSIRRDVSDEKLIRILQIVEFLNFDKEARVWSRWGDIGVQSDWTGEPYRSVPQVRAGLKDGSTTGFYYYNHAIYDDQYVENYMYGPWPNKMISEFLGTPEGRALNIRPYRWDYFAQTKLSDVNKKYGGDLRTISDEFFFKGVTGEIKIDAEWDNYVQRWLKAGGQQVLDELAKAPIVEELRKGRIAY